MADSKPSRAEVQQQVLDILTDDVLMLEDEPPLGLDDVLGDRGFAATADNLDLSFRLSTAFGITDFPDMAEENTAGRVVGLVLERVQTSD